MIVSSFNPKTAYASRRRDWSSDVCSSDLPRLAHALLHPPRIQRIHRRHPLPELVIGQRPLLVQPLETRTMLLRRVTFRHEVVLAAELPGAMRFDLFEDALAVGVVDYEQAALVGRHDDEARGAVRSEEHTSELESLMRISYAVFCLKKK